MMPLIPPRRTLALIWPAALILFGMATTLSAQETLAAAAPRPEPLDTATLVLVISIPILLIIVFVSYLFVLQWRYLNRCSEKGTMTLFHQSPGGVPPGTIRAVLAMLIVTITLYLVVLLALYPRSPFPEMLVGVLGTVLGFYFGSRSNAPGIDETLEQQVQTATRERDRVASQRDEALADKAAARVGVDLDKAGEMLTRVGSGIQTLRAVSAILPRENRERYLPVLDKLEQGYQATQGLLQARDAGQALAQASGLLKAFQGQDPVRDVVGSALGSFGKVLVGGLTSPAGLILALAGVGTKLGASAYTKWKVRVLHAPFSPAEIPLKVVTPNTGTVLLLGSPVFREVFAPELEAQDGPFLEGIVRAFLTRETADLWPEYHSRFESREQFETGLQEFRRAAADRELALDIPADWLGEVGGSQQLFEAVDQIHRRSDDNPQALADLDALVTVVETLKRNDIPAEAAIREALAASGNQESP